MSAFSFRNDFKNIQWRDTLFLNILRSTIAGFIWLILGFMMGRPPEINVFFFVLSFPLFYLLFFLPLGIFCAFLSDKGVPYIGFVSAFVALMVVVGDPVLFVLRKIHPDFVPVEKYRLFNFTMIIYILR